MECLCMKMDKKQIPRKPDFTEDKKFALCPCCNGKGLFDKQKYCDNCGQRLDQSEESEEKQMNEVDLEDVCVQDCYACPYEEQCDKSLVAQDTILNNLDEW